MITTHLQIYLLGEFRFYRDGIQVSAKDWHTSQACQLFKLLLTERGHIVSARKLADTLWPEHAEHAHKTLRSAISTLRSVLEPERERQAPSRFIPRGQAGYRLDLPADCTIWIDAVTFERLLERASTASDKAMQQELLTQALGLYTGDYLAQDEEAHWAMFERTRLRECYLKGATALMECLMEEQYYDEAIQAGRRALTINPSYEPLYRSIMRCQAANGDTAGALYTFEQCRQFFANFLGTDPSPQTLALHIAVLRGDLQKQLNKQTRTPLAPRPQKQPSSHKRKPHREQEEQRVVGRKRELQWLTQHLERAKSSTTTHMVAVVGEAGVGKSFLLRLFLQHVRHKGLLPLSCTCHALDQSMAFAPLVAMIRRLLYDCEPEELATLPATTLTRVYPLLPELSAGRLDGEMVQPLPSEQAYSLLVLGLVDVLLFVSRKHPLVLVLDDLQWADEATLLVLHRLLQLESATNKRAQDILPLVVVSYRPEDSSENQPLNAFLRYAGRERSIHTMHLARFTQEEVTEYLHLSHAAPPLSSATLYHATQGNALFLTEAVRTLLEQQDATNALAQADIVTNALLQSQQIRDVVLARVARLPQESLELLEIAAILGRPFSLALFHPLLKNDSKTFDLLLQRHFLVEVTSETGHDIVVSFFHETMRQIIVAACSALKRRYVHSVIAELLVSYYAAQREVYAAEIAFHYQRSGQKLLQALYFRVIAGDYARRIFSYRQAIVHYDVALSLLQHMMDAQHREQELDSDEWSGKVYIGKMLAYEALLDWEGMQACHRYLLTHPMIGTDRTLVEISIHRLAVTRSLMGHLLEAAQMGRSVVKRLQGERQMLDATSERKRIQFDILFDISSRWLQLLLLEDEDTTPVKNEQHTARDASCFPPFLRALPSCIQNWHETKELLGTTQAAFMFVEYGWALLLQGSQKDAEQCLLVALHAADETHQDVCWIVASMLLSSIYYNYGQHGKQLAWLERCLEHCQHHVEAPWVLLWPQINQAYQALGTQHVATAESLFHRLLTQFTQSQDFPAHRYSVDIGLGLVALEQGKLVQAQEMLSNALRHRASLNIETYVLAEVGLADIARNQGYYDEAYQRYWNMLAFCGQRSLLHLYCETALSFAHLLIEMHQTQGVAAFLREVMNNSDSAGYTHLSQRCSTLLETFSSYSYERLC